MKKDYGELEKRIGYEFKDIRLLITALTHTSFANELKVNKTESYERLEFLGDAILEYIVSDYLFHKKREYEEGKLTKLRASLVCEFTLSQISESLGYGKFVLLSKGEAQTGGRTRKSILCDRSKSTGGTGLGLAIVKHIVARNNAQLDMDSEPGKGTDISVTFDAYREDEQ